LRSAATAAVRVCTSSVSKAALNAMLQMGKIEIARMREAYEAE
jgi:hypothetical protein